MPPKSDIDLRFPVAGVDRSAAVQNQSPFTTTDALNVRPQDVTDKRERGGSRPGMVKAFLIESGVGRDKALSPFLDGPIKLLDNMDAIGIQETDIDDNFSLSASPPSGGFPSQFSNVWSEHVNHKPEAFTVGAATYAASIPGVPFVGLIHTGVPYDVTKPSVLGVQIVPFPFSSPLLAIPRQHVGTYFLFIGANNDNGGLNNGVLAEFQILTTDGIFNSKVTIFSGGTQRVVTGATGSQGGAEIEWLQLQRFDDKAFVFSFGPTVLVSDEAPPGTFTSNNQRWGFDMKPRLGDGSLGRTLVSRVNFSFTSPSVLEGTGTQKKIVIAMSGDERSAKFYRQDSMSTLVEVTDIGSTTVRLTDFYQGAQLFGDYFIAQFGTSGAVPLKPLTYSSSTDKLATWVAARGTVPSGNTMIAQHLGRMVLAGSPVYEWHMSRRGRFTNPATNTDELVGDAFDWLPTFDLGDANRPIFGANSDAGSLPEKITALISHSDDFLVFGSTSAMWIMRGDPAAGGRIDNLDAHDGVIGRFAWARGPDGSTIYLGRDGLYMLSPGGQSFPQNISISRLPNNLRQVDPRQYEVFLAYDVFYAGVHIYLTPRHSGVPERPHWWYDWKAQSFWPMSLPSRFSPGGIVYHFGDSRAGDGLLVGGEDGGVRAFSDTPFDDGEPIDSHILYGPIMLSGGSARDGLLMELHAALSEDSMDVTWSVYMGKTAEEARKRAIVGPPASFDEGTWKSGLNNVNRPRGRGQFAYVRIDGSSSTWAMERIRLKRAQLGKLRA